MKKLLLIAAVLLLGAGTLFAAKVTDISLSHQPGLTVAQINVTGQVRLTHQTEVPKKGRGHRVIVDILAATHELGQKNFSDLPNCMVESIRTSQFAVVPEQIVRFVFDVDQAPLYRIESDKNSVKILFTDKNRTNFADWNSKKASVKKQKPVSPKVVVAKVATPKVAAPKVVVPKANKPVVAAVTTKKAPTKSVPVVASVKPAPPVKKSNDHDLELFAMSNRTDPSQWSKTPVAKTTETTPQVKTPAADKAPVVVKAPAPKTPAADKAPVVAQAPAPKKPAADKAPVVAKAPAKKSSERRPVVTVAAVKSTNPPDQQMPSKKNMKPAGKKNAAVKKDSKPQVTKPAVAKAKPAKKEKTGQTKLASKISGTKTKIASAPKTKKAKPSNTKTSRFRRSANQAKVKGTMVVEFPKRLVIKYKGSRYRDPFETLINANRTNNNPIEKRVPNIDGLRLVGVIESDLKSDRALFEDTHGFGYILKSGDKVRNGYVLRVETDRVYFQIFEYGWSRTVALQLDN